ncbi:cysteine hydrolase [Spirosoma sp. BT702]|uniref:Cysteine hydrolase n=2 Tax=Spirosoma profusum TaxID=2771354 RepID=A0A926XYA3_9BACT|nr:cysteine hydrolase [Spirosoma profusum]
MTFENVPALLLIDIQQGFDDVSYWGNHRNNLDAESNCKRLLDHWRTQTWPVFHIQHCSANPTSLLADGQPGNKFKEIVQPLAGEPIIRKQVNSAFIGTDLQQRLAEAGIKTLVIAGLTTDHCVSTTTRMAGNYGYDTFVVSDATATFNRKGYNGEEYSADQIHATALASLHGEFATVTTTSQLLMMGLNPV